MNNANNINLNVIVWKPTFVDLQSGNPEIAIYFIKLMKSYHSSIVKCFLGFAYNLINLVFQTMDIQDRKFSHWNNKALSDNLILYKIYKA